MIQKMISFFKPKEDKYIALLHGHFHQVRESVVLLIEFSQTTNREQRKLLQQNIINLEREADKIQSEIDATISHSLMLPFDRSYMFRILDAADDIIDNIRKATATFVRYDYVLDDNDKDTLRLIDESTNILMKSILLLDKIPKNADALRQNMSNVVSYESLADINREKTYSILFPEALSSDVNGDIMRNTTVENILIKECIDRIEKIANACESMAKAISIVVMDNA